MAATFHCPHCEKAYPNNPALIGRKVRCSECKGVFQLQGDGVALKVETAKPKVEQQGQRSATARQQLTRQLKSRTKRLKGQSPDEKIANSRSALRDAADAALSGVQEERKQEEDTRRQQKSSRMAAAKSVEIYRSGTTNSPARSTKIVLALLVFCGLSYFVSVLFVDAAPEVQALRDFSKRVGKERASFPLRMNEYRKRMWIYTRDGVESPHIILNADNARFVGQYTLDWSKISEICHRHFGGMSVLPFFAIMVSSDKQAKVEKIWEQYVDKFYLEGFYKLLKDQGIRFVHCRNIPSLLSDQGLSEVEVYVVSILLSGTADESGAPCPDFGLLSTISAEGVLLYEFKGAGGMELVERASAYEVLGSSHFCGLVLGVTGIAGQANEWRILDLRQGPSMSQYYQEQYNPFYTINDRAKKYIHTHFGNPHPEAPNLDIEVQQ